MTQDEIRKLLGGYATDTLTDEERRMLFEAALEDQELFNALQTEDALKELVDDPVTRGQLHATLQPRPRSFLWRRWMFGVAVPAAIALVVVFFMNRANAPRLVALKQAAPEITTPPPTPAPAVQATPPAPLPEAKTKSKAMARVVKKIAPAPPAPAPATVARLEPRPLAAPAMANFRAATLSPVVPEAVRQQLSGGLAPNAPLYQGPLVRYALVRSGPNGDAVRVEVTTGIAGYVALYEMGAAGNSKRVYPPGEEAARVLPNAPIQIPAEPLPTAEGSRLRLVLVPAPAPVNPVLTGAETSIVTGAANSTAPAPLVIDIPVAR